MSETITISSYQSTQLIPDSANEVISITTGGTIDTRSLSTIGAVGDAIYFSLGTIGLLENLGLIEAAGEGVFAAGIGTVINYGKITGIGGGGLSESLTSAPITIDNYGTIGASTTNGVGLTTGPGYIYNSGLIIGTRGIQIRTATIENDGAITGGQYSLDYFSYSSEFISDPNSTITGHIFISIANGNTFLLGETSATNFDYDTLISPLENNGHYTTLGFTPDASRTLGLSLSDLTGTTIDNFAGANTIDLIGTVVSAASYANSVLTLFDEDDDPIGTIALINSAVPDSNGFVVSDDGNGGTDITPCFCPGTRILTDRGNIPVENLAIGDNVTTVRATGPGSRRIIWIGRRHINLATHPAPEQTRPIKILAGAFGENLPARDLRVSPKHAIYLDGHLFEAASLINHTTVFQEQATRAVTYYHVELDAHDILLSENLPTESFLDTGNRYMFNQSEGIAPLAMDNFYTRLPETGCVPLITTGPRLAAARKSLAVQAEFLTAKQTQTTAA